MLWDSKGREKQKGRRKETNRNEEREEEEGKRKKRGKCTFIFSSDSLFESLSSVDAFLMPNMISEPGNLLQGHHARSPQRLDSKLHVGTLWDGSRAHSCS